MERANFFFDTEFIEAPDLRIYPISMGIVCEDGRELYVEWAEIPWEKANSWVIENVKPYLTDLRYTNDEIRKMVSKFCGHGGKFPRFWAWYGAYDWLVMAQMFGTMMDLPRHFPMFTMDLMQSITEKQISREALPEQTGTKHNALEDARWNYEVWKFVYAAPTPSFAT